MLLTQRIRPFTSWSRWCSTGFAPNWNIACTRVGPLVRLGNEKFGRNIEASPELLFATTTDSHVHTHSSDRQPHTASNHRRKARWVYSFSPKRGKCGALHRQSSHAQRAQLTEWHSAGYALLKSKDKKIFDKGEELKDVSTLVESLKLKKFQKFENAVTALNEAAALTDGKVSSMLSNLLQDLKDETKASRTCAP